MAILMVVIAAGAPPSCAADIPRTPEGRPDFSGTYDVATLTPLERPQMFGNKLYLSPEEAERIAAEMRQLKEADLERSDPNREAPPKGGDGSQGAAGNVGGYNAFWIDNGEAAFMTDRNFEAHFYARPRYCQAALAPRGKLCLQHPGDPTASPDP